MISGGMPDHVRVFVMRALVALALVACVPAPIDSAYWWRSPRFVTALKLTRAQAAAIDRIYRDTLPARLERAREADAVRARLDRLLDARAAIEDLEAAASRAADAEAELSRLRTLMLYRMSRVLTPSQRARFTALARSRSRTPRAMPR
jgi:Spy/CpxP family protein refolding chaperone